MTTVQASSIGPIQLTPGVQPQQVLIFVIVSMCGYAVFGFIPLMLPYVLTEQLHLPQELQGRATASVSLAQQVATIIFIVLFGALADRIGRRLLLTASMFVMALATFLFPMSPTIYFMVAFSFLLGIGQTLQTAGGATSVIDYPDNASRGKFISLMLVTQGLTGALLVGQVGAQIPRWLTDAGLTAIDAGRYAFWFIASFGLVASFLAARGLSVDRKQQSAGAFSPKKEAATIWANLKLVMAYAKKNPRFRVVLLVACVLRSDFFIVVTYLSLWVISSARGQMVDTATSLQRAGTLMAVLQVAFFVTPLALAYFVDRFDRIKLIMVSLAFCSISFTSTALVQDIFGTFALVVVACIGLSEGAMIITTQSLLGQEAPEDLRGSAMGIFILLGILGVAFINVLGGYLFDTVHFSAPFVLVGVLNLIAFVAALTLRRRHSE
jgi:MFS family permease